MSIECSECGRTPYSGHAVECSRYDVIDGVSKVIARHCGQHPDDEEWRAHPVLIACATEVVGLLRTHAAAIHKALEEAQ